ncbi:hypothetical protein GCM10009838_52580 [Catenulispora subtropica]|uniref:Major facilitator superfamily MFS_1 n=1 Tax=Catenulispora subtropica TaxID=450798 RepID=A0ABN2SC58_9ACTN
MERGTVGWILGAFSVGGAVSGSVLAARADRVTHAEMVIAASLLLAAALLLAQGVTARAGAIGVAALLGATTGAATVLSNARLQSEADPRLLGRVTAVTTLGTLGLSPLLFPLVGVVAARWGTEAFFVGCAAVCLVAALVAAWPPPPPGRVPPPPGRVPTPSGRPTAAAADARPTPLRPRTPPRSPRR